MIISKTRYIRGFQCPKMIWLDINNPEAATDSIDESILETGREVGELAKEYFGEFSLVDYYPNPEIMAVETEKCLEKSQVIAEATFIYDDLYCRVDLLKRNGEGFDIIEVKSSTDVDDIHLQDLAFQYYVLTNSGLKITGAYLMYINSKYVREGYLDLHELFILEDRTSDILCLQNIVEAQLGPIRRVMKEEQMPANDIGIYCNKPYDCIYQGFCKAHVPSPSVFDINKLKTVDKYSYYRQGIISYSDIVEKRPKLSEKQWMQVESAHFNYPPFVDKKGIEEFLDSLKYPLYHLDFETFQQAVPKWDGVNPYMQIPFQYSLHVQNTRDGALEHFEYLGQPGEDPRRKLAEQLCHDIPLNVCSLAYNMSFEKRVIKSLANQYPDLSDHLMNIHDNMKDLMVPFQKQHFYCKELQGSYSIKYVLPAVCPGDPELDYHNLDGIHNGSEAMSAYAVLDKKSAEEIEETRKNLLAYCCLDTLAMVKILEKLYEMIE